jgi:shikimate kinase
LAEFGVSVFIDVSSNVLEQRLSPERLAALNNPDGLSFADLHARRLGAYRAAAQLVLPVPVEQPIDRTVEQLVALCATV